MGDYDFVIRLKPKITEEKLSILSKSLIQNGFEVRLFPSEQPIEKQMSPEERLLFTKYCDYTYLLQKAEELKIQKRMSDQYLQEEYFHTDSQTPKSDGLSQEQYAKHQQEEKFRSNKMKQFVEIKSELPNAVNRMEKYRKFKYSEKHKFSKLTNDQDIFEKIFTASEQLMIKQAIIHNIICQEKNLIESFREYGVIHNPIPLHQKSQKPTSTDVSEIRNYFGDNISIYFVFVEFFQKQLIPLAILGVFVGLLNSFYGFDSQSSPFDSIYSAIVIFWGTYFFAKWKKHERQTKIHNCSQSQRQLKKTNKTVVSQEDEAQFTQKIDYVTGQKDLHFPTSKRIIRYILGGLKLLPYISVAIAFLIVSLNIRGYVDPDHEFLFIDFQFFHFYFYSSKRKKKKYVFLIEILINIFFLKRYLIISDIRIFSDIFIILKNKYLNQYFDCFFFVNFYNIVSFIIIKEKQKQSKIEYELLYFELF